MMNGSILVKDEFEQATHKKIPGFSYSWVLLNFTLTNLHVFIIFNLSFIYACILEMEII